MEGDLWPSHPTPAPTLPLIHKKKKKAELHLRRRARLGSIARSVCQQRLHLIGDNSDGQWQWRASKAGGAEHEGRTRFDTTDRQTNTPHTEQW